jgi:hypothetical protein
MEKVILVRISEFIPNNRHQHAYKKNHSTTTAMHELNNIIVSGFNEKVPPKRTVSIALDMSRAFDTVNHEILIEKLMNNTQIPIYIKYIANYMRGRKGYTDYHGARSKERVYSCGGVLSPVLFNLYMADIPQPEPHAHKVKGTINIVRRRRHADSNSLRLQNSQNRHHKIFRKSSDLDRTESVDAKHW